MPTLPPAVLDRIARRHGVIDRTTLRAHGLTPSAIDRRARCGVLEAIHPGVFRLAGSPDTLEQRLVALCDSVSEAVVSHTTAARLWGLRRIPDLGIRCTVPSQQTLELTDIRVHRSNALSSVDIVEREDGIRLTSPPRTAFDLASLLDADALGSVLEQLLDERKCSIGALLDVQRRLARPGRPGSTRFREVLGNRPRGQVALMSNWEWKVEQALRKAGISGLVRQHPVRLAGIGLIRLDFSYPHLRLAIEVDGLTWHGTRPKAVQDRRRDRKLAAIGWRVIRVSDDDLRYRFADTIADIVSVVFA